jgi:DNA polymerase III subunit beta
MKFVVSSSDLLSHLQAISRVISNKNTLPILDNFLFKLEGKDLEITASDLESTFITRMILENASESGSIAIPAKIILDTLKEFADQPLTFDVNSDTQAIVIISANGQFTIMGQNGIDFPQVPALKADKTNSIRVNYDVLANGINKTLFATADDELRPVMNGIFVELSGSSLTFVASDSHKLVRYRRNDIKPGTEASFILPKKPAGLLKNILAKESSDIVIEFDDKNAVFTLTNYKLICRLVEGTYPSYSSVIPTNHPNTLTIDRLELYNSLRRVSVFANQASNLVKLSIDNNQVNVSAQDLDFSISAFERINGQYEGETLEIGFKSVFLIEILSNLSSGDVVFKLGDPSRAGIMFPAETEVEGEDVLMLIMPMMIS